jgi:hypothetical protein
MMGCCPILIDGASSIFTYNIDFMSPFLVPLHIPNCVSNRDVNDWELESLTLCLIF